MVSRSLLSLVALPTLGLSTATGLRRLVSDTILDPPAILPIAPDQDTSSRLAPTELEFKLKHIFHHGTYKYPGMHRRLDIHPDVPLWVIADTPHERIPSTPLRARSAPLTIQRLADRSASNINSILDIGRMVGRPVSLPASAWIIDRIPGPNVTDKESVISFARMASNAYDMDPGTGDWQDVGGAFNYTEDFGWESDGLRGHIFADTENRTIVIGLKGTSPAVFDGSETTTNDKINDNLFFSCCCGQGGQYLWKQVCECQSSAYTCNSTCLTEALRNKNRYYYAAQDLYYNVTELYPTSDIWVVGHSLGGSVSSLLGLTFGLPVVSFEAPGEAMPAARLGLPTPPGYRIGAHQQRVMTGGYHFGHTADPIYMGTCNGASSFCTIAGYAMQSMCHSGLECVYDTVGDFGWRVGIGSHRIDNVIRNVLEKYETPAKCEERVNCTDCYVWKYFESNGTSSTITSSSTTSSKTRTRTHTCNTPGWWGCLDETTTSDMSTTDTGSTSTSTCKTPGWFGCKDPIATVTSTSSSISAVPTSTVSTTLEPTSSPTITCKTPGWFGCRDPTRASNSLSWTTPPTTIAPTAPLSSPPHTTKSPCVKRKWYGFICADESTTASKASSALTLDQIVQELRR